MSIKFRDGMCTGPTCHKAATESDMDHAIPHPEGPTTAINLNNACKPEHRAKTFAGHVTARTGPHTTTWTTPTGHTYLSEDPALPVEEWTTVQIHPRSSARGEILVDENGDPAERMASPSDAANRGVTGPAKQGDSSGTNKSRRRRPQRNRRKQNAGRDVTLADGGV